MFKKLLLSAALASLTMASFSAKAAENGDQRAGIWSEWGDWETVNDGGSPVFERRERWIYVDTDGDCRSEIQIHNLSRKRIAVHCNFVNETTSKSTDEWWVSIDPDEFGTDTHTFPTKSRTMRWHWECGEWEKTGPGDFEYPSNTGCRPAPKQLGAGLAGVWDASSGGGR